jgi:hypothetical protein
MALVVWISEILTTFLTSYFQNRQPFHYQRKYDPQNVTLDLGLSNISKHEIDKTATKLIQRGFLMGPLFSYKNSNSLIEEKCMLTIILSPELLQKLSIQYGVPLDNQNAEEKGISSSSRTFLVIKSIEIIERADILGDIFLIHNQIELERMTKTIPPATASAPTPTPATSHTTTGSSTPSLHDLTSYFGPSTSVFFSWMKYTLLWLHFSSLFGLILFLSQFFQQNKLEFSFTPLLCLLTSLGSLFYDKTLQQHLSLSIFSWGNVSIRNYLPSLTTSTAAVMTGFTLNVHPIPPLITALLMSCTLSVFYLSIIVLMQFFEVDKISHPLLALPYLSQRIFFTLTPGIVLSRSSGSFSNLT